MSLDLRDVCVDIGARRIVSDICLRVEDGCFVGLLGPNGSGKSTILKAIYRVHRPAQGRVFLDGVELHELPARDVAQRLAVVAQESSGGFAVSVTEMVMLGRIPHKSAFAGETEQDREIAAHAIERVGCTALARRSFHTLSGGEKQRVLIARALAQGADHLILDEPTNHLDVRYQVEVLELVAGLGVTVLAAIHDLGLAALYCDTVHLLAGGRLVAGGSPAAVITPEAIREVYGADVSVVAHPDTGAPQPLPRRLADPPSKGSRPHVRP
jgi:iron complex transport system ATP-binding protein